MRALTLACLLFLIARPAWAVIPVVDETSLAVIIKQNILQAVRAEQTLAFARTLASEMADVAFFARDAVKGANNIRMVINDPERFARLAVDGWADAYPDVHAILAHTLDTRMALQELSDPEFYRVYDPYAYVRAFDSLQNVTHGAYDIAARATDLWRVHDAHAKNMQQLHDEHQAATEALGEVARVINRLGMSPDQAVVHTSKTSAITAMASVQAAATLEKMTTRQEVSFMNDGAAAEDARTRRMQMHADYGRVYMDWSLDPTGQRGR